MNEERKIVEVAAGVLIRKADGTVLMGSRPEGKPYAGYWEFPGGKFEPGENADAALRRELSEELNLKIGPSYPWIFKVQEYPHAKVRLHFRRCWEWEGEPESMEHQQFGFYRRGALPSGELLPMDEIIAGWIELPEIAAYIGKEGNGETLQSRADRAVKAGARLLWIESGAAVSVPDCVWVGGGDEFSAAGSGDRFRGAFAKDASDAAHAAAEHADFVFAQSRSAGFFKENECPIYVPGESAEELAEVMSSGAHGLWLSF